MIQRQEDVAVPQQDGQRWHLQVGDIRTKSYDIVNKAFSSIFR